jgi:hypothetical protein
MQKEFRDDIHRSSQRAIDRNYITDSFVFVCRMRRPISLSVWRWRKKGPEDRGFTPRCRSFAALNISQQQTNQNQCPKAGRSTMCVHLHHLLTGILSVAEGAGWTSRPAVVEYQPFSFAGLYNVVVGRNFERYNLPSFSGKVQQMTSQGGSNNKVSLRIFSDRSPAGDSPKRFLCETSSVGQQQSFSAKLFRRVTGR